ncbi:hypothetical protein LTS18_001719 [Coniosporium uncinatum]|uniref:Uncharacterized protein n=1 Tax=Coniosporium uncinatum TaxID=93489 RepID=A0ACC3DED5_9PEZI|nr:hypothetical protein LTS18_001719 [Coniosporium uncinatum]
MLGNGGEKVLTDEVKWLAITHKSFDHGRRGFNDRLAFLGKRIVDLQTSIALLAAPRSVAPASQSQIDSYGRQPFQHPALQTLDNLSDQAKAEAVNKQRLARLADRYGMDKVIRWKPKKADNLQGSGIDSVLAQTMYAIVGAIALERGGETAVKVVRERMLTPMGLV